MNGTLNKSLSLLDKISLEYSNSFYFSFITSVPESVAATRLIKEVIISTARPLPKIHGNSNLTTKPTPKEPGSSTDVLLPVLAPGSTKPSHLLSTTPVVAVFCAVFSKLPTRRVLPLPSRLSALSLRSSLVLLCSKSFKSLMVDSARRRSMYVAKRSDSWAATTTTATTCGATAAGGECFELDVRCRVIV